MFFGATAFAEAPFSSEGIINQSIEVTGLQLQTNVSTVAISLGIDVHAGHGLTYKSAKILSKIQYINEFNIGHFLIGESIFSGLNKTIKKFKLILRS